MPDETDADRRWREGVETQDRMHRIEEQLAAKLREHVDAEVFIGDNEPRLACPVCNRTDITIKKDGTLRQHSGEPATTWNGRRLRAHCNGSGKKPKEG